MPIPSAVEALSRLPFSDLGFARIDHHRALRTGVPEVVLAAGKQPEHLVAIVKELQRGGGNVLCTRVSPEQAQAIITEVPHARYHALCRLLTVLQVPVVSTGQGTVLVVSAGTSDLPVAEEAAVTAELLGSQVERLCDVGVAGLHRILAAQDALRQAAVLVVVAGMEGALPSVIGGLTSVPVVAVPTSVGYGASLEGVTALLGMLASCAAGITVVGIDNGYGAACAAARLFLRPGAPPSDVREAPDARSAGGAS